MNYFTPEWFTLAPSAGTVDDAMAAYRRRIDAIAARLPPAARRLASELDLHDGIVEKACADAEAGEIELSLRAGDLQRGYFTVDIVYRGVDRAPLDFLSTVAAGGVELLADEVDLEASGCVHRLLFAGAREVVIAFRALELSERPRADRAIAIPASRRFDRRPVALFRAAGCAVRPLTDGDLATTLEVYRGCEDFLSLGPVPTASMEMVLADVAHSKEEAGAYCGIWSGDGVQIGVLDFVPELSAGTAYLSLLMIALPHRRKGLGAAIVTALEEYLKRTRGTTLVESGVQVNNEPGLRFWRKLGFDIGTTARALDDGTTAYEMKKRI